MTDKIEFEEESKLWLAFWCCEGLEAMISVSEYMDRSKQELSEKIKTGTESRRNAESELNHVINGMQIRARMNGNRNYELYTFNANASMTQAQLREWFECAPQLAVDWIRKNGKCFLKKYDSSNKVIR